MSNLTDFFPSGGGGGLTPKFQEFNSSGTFTPSQALIDAGGYIEVFLVGGGGGGSSSGSSNANGGQGGDVLSVKLYLTSTNGIAVNIGAGGAQADPGGDGGNSSFLASSSGAVDVVAKGGRGGTAAPVTARYINSSLASNFPAMSGKDSIGQGVNGYGKGGGRYNGAPYSFYFLAPNSGQGGNSDQGYSGGIPQVVNGASGYCLIKWYE